MFNYQFSRNLIQDLKNNFESLFNFDIFHNRRINQYISKDIRLFNKNYMVMNEYYPNIFKNYLQETNDNGKTIQEIIKKKFINDFNEFLNFKNKQQS